MAWCKSKGWYSLHIGVGILGRNWCVLDTCMYEMKVSYLFIYLTAQNVTCLCKIGLVKVVKVVVKVKINWMLLWPLLHLCKIRLGYHDLCLNGCMERDPTEERLTNLPNQASVFQLNFIPNTKMLVVCWGPVSHMSGPSCEVIPNTDPEKP